jgi:outer membrane lipoprotein-sorting protein
MAHRTRTRLTALVIVVLILALAAVGIASISGAQADESPSLPAVSADSLLGSALDASASLPSISGEVGTTLDLGLPDLPSGLGGGALGPLASVLGTQRYKVWSSPDGIRVAHLMDLGEQTFVANDREAWFWQSDGMQATHVAYPDAGAAWKARSGEGWLRALATEPDPTAVAARALTALAPYATVTVDGTARVAGRPVYQLVLTPTSELTLVGSVTVAIDADTRVPLRLQVFARGAIVPAIEAGFTSVSFDPIDPAMFTFDPPPGTDVHTPSVPSRPQAAPARPTPTVRTFGTGFDTRVAVRLNVPLPEAAQAVLPYAGPLASVLPVMAGGHTWVVFGLVGLETLRADAGSLAA